MKEMNKNRFNAVDIIVIAIVILGIAVAAFIFLRPEEVSTQTDGYIDFTIELPTVKNKFKGLIKADAPVMETVRHTPMGYVVKADYTDAVIATTDMENGGVMSMGSYPDHQRAEIVIRTKYSLNDNGEYTVGGTAIAVGAFLNFSTPDFITSGYCVNIDFPDEQTISDWESHIKALKAVKEAE